MHLRSLHLKNFRGFADLELNFERDLTVLVGTNGSGKTSILEALAYVVVRALGGSAWDFTEGDRHLGSTVTSIAVQVASENGSGAFSESFDGGAHSQTDTFQRVHSAQPFLFYYPVDRNARDVTPGSTNPGHWEPTRALEKAAHSTARFEDFFLWFREREDLENEDRRDRSQHRDSQLDAVRAAVEAVLPGYKNLRVRRPRFDTQAISTPKPELVLDKRDQSLGFSQFSMGERTLVALVADIARRAAIARPRESHLEADGIVLIDEIELHLHPGWQATIIDRLRKTFPRMQFVLATHSPIVLSQVAAQSVRILSDFKLLEPTAPTKGRDPNALLTEVFSVPLRPADVQLEIAGIANLIDGERLEEAKLQLSALRLRLGESDSDVTRLRTMLELLSA